ncbi:NEW3 domain-containing protein [Patulibacter medicamentivorans]|uniref:NEW3 domain-containing protein n=1 Tax=Patulibacter medicamentivorans TaxID=1097667 RepID=UPI000A313CB7|nr:NEW3 domain-containing protein [Patulibacter medicamentivorans]
MRTAALAVTGVAIVGLAAVPAASADTPITVAITDGRFTVGTVRDIAVATAAKPGKLTGTVAADNRTVTIPASGVQVPTYVQAGGGATITTTFAAAGNLTGTLDVNARTVSLSGPFDITFRAEGLPAAYHVDPVSCRISGAAFGFSTGNVTVPAKNASGASAPVTYAGALLDRGTGRVALSGISAAPLPSSQATTSGAGAVSDAQVCKDLDNGIGLPTAGGFRFAGTVSAPGLVPSAPVGGDGNYGGGTQNPPAAKTPRIKLALGKLKRVARGKLVTAKIKVTNTGTASAKSVRIQLKAPAGVKLSRRTLTTKTLKAGASKTFRVNLRPGKRAKSGSRLRATATATGVTTTRKSQALRLTRGS